ncbi:vitamin B6 photo-protection and homoeostasis-domain-containing protein [Lentinula aciculospora]|uniref:Vitamin B6 photo-protection and homoeostasis-domain-containing protein n=1 Tax=Lentinula aciculospora TaxID=153920 RepID=A0A9W9DKT0_9AGAR|nr:vitamin B6 photo-protection and homoeostasis-domain-containing protein [Lentinula aciculospora]
MEITERDEAGHITRITIKPLPTGQVLFDADFSENTTARASFLSFIAKVFLPAGYPRSVSPDYLRYQILNAAQAFCSSLASLLSSRATLEGYGVGNASASSTNALLLTVLQDISNRLTTIIAAFFFGSSLLPEAKMYRFLADLLNDAAIVIDTLSPLLVSLYDAHVPAFMTTIPFLPPTVPLRVYTLCLSASIRALCGIVAGGSKTAITMHFATPLEGTGDIGDLNAKDSSKETVLALLGMLIGTMTVPYLTTTWSTYTVLFSMVFLHLSINYIGVRSIIFRSLNRQRACLAWMAFKSKHDFINTPTCLASLEHILMHSDVILGFPSGIILGRCTMGSSFAACHPDPELLNIFQHKRYVLCLDRKSSLSAGAKPHFHIILKHGYNSADQLHAWLFACEVTRLFASMDTGTIGLYALIQEAFATFDENYLSFLEDLHTHGWITVALTSDESTINDSEYRSPPLLHGSQTVSFSSGAPKSVMMGSSRAQYTSKKDQ